jgi:hypothetical protein
MANAPNSSSDGYYFLPYTLPTHLPGLISTNPQDSPHMPVAQKALPPEIPGVTDIQPERVGCDFGMDMSFKYIPNDYEVLKGATLMLHMAPLAAAGGGLLPRYPDYLLATAIENIQFQIGGATIWQKSGEEIILKEIVETAPEEFSRICGAEKLILSAADRAALAALPDGFWIFCDIPMWWSETAAKHWHQYACQRQTRINIKWRNPDAILQQDNVNQRPTPVGSSTYIKEAYLRFNVSALDTAVKDTYTSGVKQQGSTGLNYLVQFTQKQENQILVHGNKSFMIPLTNFNKPTYMLRFIIRKVADLTPNYTNNQRFACQNIASYWMDASGHRLWPKTSSEYAKWCVNARYFLNNPTINVFHVLHTDYPDVTQYPMGDLEYGKLQNPTLFIEFDANLQEDHVVDVWAHCFDYLRLVITQDNRSAVNLEQPI